MSRPDLMPLAEEERADLLATLRRLTPDQWEGPSLCDGWRVRDVAAHVVSYDELSAAGLMRAFLRGGLRPSRVNDVALAPYRGLDPDGIIALVARTQRPRGLTAAMRGGIALTDTTIHHQDIRRALELPRSIPEHRLVPVLSIALAAPTLPAKRNVRRLRLVATDIDWSSGHGREVTGPAEALLMAAAGRQQALDELDGDGLPTLRERVRGQASPS